LELLERKASATATIDARKAAVLAANIAESKKGFGIVVLDVRQVTLIADYFVVIGGDSSPQVRAIADAIDEGLTPFGYQPRAIEGKKDGRWVLLDYGDIIVHVLQEKDRTFYKLEQFWNNALVVDRGEWVQDLDGDLPAGGR